MTDRHAAYLVVLDEDMREDDAEQIAAALRLIRGIASVEPAPIDGNYQIAIAQSRERSIWRQKILALLADTP